MDDKTSAPADKFDLLLQELESWVQERTSQFLSPGNMRKIVLSLLTGGNFRKFSERNVAELTTIYASWMLQICAASKKVYKNGWREKILETARMSKNSSARDLRTWVLTATSKTLVNLASGSEDLSYLTEFIADNVGRVKTHKWNPAKGIVTLTANFSTGETVAFDLDESTWLLRMAGSSATAIRGAVKSSFGKRLERAFLKSCFGMLDMVENTHYKLNSQPIAAQASVKDGERNAPQGKEGRERDAVIVLNSETPTEAILEMGLIGKGNSEVVNDKIKRVSELPNGIVIYDMLPARSSAKRNAEKKGVSLISLREMRLESPIHELHEYLKKRVAYKIGNPPKPTDFELALLKMNDSVFSLGGEETKVISELSTLAGDVDAETIDEDGGAAE